MGQAHKNIKQLKLSVITIHKLLFWAIESWLLLLKHLSNVFVKTIISEFSISSKKQMDLVLVMLYNILDQSNS